MSQFYTVGCMDAAPLPATS